MQECLSLFSIILLIISGIVFLRIPLLARLLSYPYRLLLALLKKLGLFKESQIWSVVYDSKTKVPIDPAYVTVKNPLGVEMASMITDLNGRFSLILPPGVYDLSVQKSNYEFPSELMNYAHTDGDYTNLYYGDRFHINESERVITIAIPMDPIAVDWNQLEKKKQNVLSSFNTESVYRGAEVWYVLIGIIFTGKLYFATMNRFYLLVLTINMALILAVLIWRLFEPTNYMHSSVFDKEAKLPLAFARVTVFKATNDTQIMRKITSYEGEFTALLPTGRYYITIDRRDEHGTYSPAYTSKTFHIREGYIGKRFTV